MTDSLKEICHDTQKSGMSQPYVSCIRIYGRSILPPLMTAERRDEMQHYKALAELIEVKMKKKKNSIKGTLKYTAEDTAPKDTPALIMESHIAKESANKDTSFKCIDTQEILEEFDPFAPLSCSTENRQSGSTDEFSKTGSSDMSVTNSTDLYQYMDITGSSIGDGRSTRRSLTPAPDVDWNSSIKINLSGDQEIKATYEGLNEYLDSILVGNATPPSRAKCSDEEATPTNDPLSENLQIMCLEDDKRSKSCPLSPIPREPILRDPIPDSGNLTEKLVDIIVEPTERADTGRPRLVRSNSYTLDTPSPMLLAHLEAEKRKNDTWKVKKPDVKPVTNIRKVLGVEKRTAGVAFKRNDLSENRVTHSPPKKAKSPAVPRSPYAFKSPKVDLSKARKELIGQPEIRRLFADLQVEHNRQMEQLLQRQRKEQEMIREAILKQKASRGPLTWAHYLRTKSVETEAKQDVHSPTSDQVGSPNIRKSLSSDQVVSPNIRKSLSSSFMISQMSNISTSVPLGSIASTLADSPKRPSSSPALTSSVSRAANGTDTNGNLTGRNLDTVLIPQILPPSDPQPSKSALIDNEKVVVNETSPRTRRRAWNNPQATSQDPDWLMHWAASKIQARIRGYLTRRLLRTERVQGCITVIHDTILCALELQRECARNIEPSDLQLHGRLIHQLSVACRDIHSIFVEIPVSKRMAIIAMDRERLESRSPRSEGPRPLSRATQIALTRKMAQNNSNSAGTMVSTTRRKNWANNNIKRKISTHEPCEIVPTCLSRSSTTSNGETQRSLSGGGMRKPWR